jgi:hypothetical protein
MLTPWDASDPLQMPARPRGRYVPTDDVRRVDLAWLAVVQESGSGE